MMATRQVAFGGKQGEKPFTGSIITVRIAEDDLEFGITLSEQNGIIDWGDGESSDAIAKQAVIHIYSKSGDYQIKIDAITNFSLSKKAQLYEIKKWADDLSKISEVAYRDIINCRFVAGWDGPALSSWVFYRCARDAESTGGNESSVGPFPNVTKLNAYTFSYMYKLKYLYLDGTIETMENNSVISIGINLAADAQGIKSVIRVANTCDSLLAIANFPGGAPTATKWQCADGNVIYKGGAWIKEAL